LSPLAFAATEAASENTVKKAKRITRLFRKIFLIVLLFCLKVLFQEITNGKQEQAGDWQDSTASAQELNL
jgi:hypothetical protein